MRQLLINELLTEEHQQISTFLDNNAETAAIPGIYWLPIPPKILAPAQQGHQECGPFVFGIELLEDSISLEFLVRSKRNLHCSCTAYATSEQRQFLLDFHDKMIQTTDLKS